jgi:uncharacterized protein
MKQLQQILAIVWILLLSGWLWVCTLPGYGVGPVFMTAVAVEVSLYLSLALPSSRRQWMRLEKDVAVVFIIAAGLLPYLIYAPWDGRFDFAHFLMMAAAVSLAALFYRNGVSLERDLWFLAMMAAVTLLDANKFWFTGGDKKIPASLLGQLMWIRTGMAALFLVRPASIAQPSLWPQLQQWKTGLSIGLLTCLVVFPVSILVEFGRLKSLEAMARSLPTAISTFFGILWVVALSEELFFRGLLMPRLDEGLRSKTASLILTSLLFGAVHLPARQFPNWRFALLATIAGLFYGIAARKHSDLGAAMVAHALVVAIWRILY